MNIYAVNWVISQSGLKNQIMFNKHCVLNFLNSSCKKHSIRKLLHTFLPTKTNLTAYWYLRIRDKRIFLLSTAAGMCKIEHSFVPVDWKDMMLSYSKTRNRMDTIYKVLSYYMCHTGKCYKYTT